MLFKKVVTVSIFSIDLPRITILTPELERLKAIELPKIPVPPVITATLPFKSKFDRLYSKNWNFIKHQTMKYLIKQTED